MLMSTAAAAQIGYLPTRSPFLDLEHSQEITLIAGNYHGHRDPADVAPQGGFLVGAHYEWRVAGPAHLTGEVTRGVVECPNSQSARLRCRPQLGHHEPALVFRQRWTRTEPDRREELASHRSRAFVGCRIHLGFPVPARHWRVQVRHPLCTQLGGGIRWVPGGSWQVRGDFTNKLYTISYPETFFLPPTGGTAVVPSTQARSFWTNNPAFTLGLSRLF